MQLSPFTDFCFLFLSIVLEGAPFILLGTVISGIIDAYLPPGLIDRWLPKNKPVAVILSALLGAIFPVCECTIVPVIRRLIKKGLPISCAVTYMLSAPIINPITVISTMNAFQVTTNDPYKILKVNRDSTDEEIKKSFEKRIRKFEPDAEGGFKNEEAARNHKRLSEAFRRIGTEDSRGAYERMAQVMGNKGKQDTYSAAYMTVSRLFVAFLVTVAVGMILLRVRKKQILVKSLADDDSVKDSHDRSHVGHSHDDEEDEAHDHDHSHEHDHSHDEPKPNKPVLAMRTALRDFVETAMYFTIGVAITAVFKAFVTDDLVMVFNQSEPVGVGLMMMLAFILSLCSTSDAFIAANFPVPQSARLAFLVYGPMMDVKLIFMYLSVFRKKFVLILAVSLFFAIGVLCYVWFKL